MTVERCRHCSAEIIWATTENGKRVPLDAELISEGPRFQVVGDEGELLARYFDWTAKLNGKLVVGHRYHRHLERLRDVGPQVSLVNWRAVAKNRGDKLDRIGAVVEDCDPEVMGLEVKRILDEPDGVGLGRLRDVGSEVEAS